MQASSGIVGKQVDVPAAVAAAAAAAAAAAMQKQKRHLLQFVSFSTSPLHSPSKQTNTFKLKTTEPTICMEFL